MIWGRYQSVVSRAIIGAGDNANTTQCQEFFIANSISVGRGKHDLRQKKNVQVPGCSLFMPSCPRPLLQRSAQAPMVSIATLLGRWQKICCLSCVLISLIKYKVLWNHEMTASCKTMKTLRIHSSRIIGKAVVAMCAGHLPPAQTWRSLWRAEDPTHSVTISLTQCTTESSLSSDSYTVLKHLLLPPVSMCLRPRGSCCLFDTIHHVFLELPKTWER